MAKEILDDFDWQKGDNTNESLPTPRDESSVVMLKSFTTEEEAQVCAAALKSEGIDAHVITSTTGVMTPFAYGNIRLFVAESQEEEALIIIRRLDAISDVYDNPKVSSERIFAIIAIGIFIIGFFIYLLQRAIYGL
jgi:hypothetical protein